MERKENNDRLLLKITDKNIVEKWKFLTLAGSIFSKQHWIPRNQFGVA